MCKIIEKLSVGEEVLDGHVNVDCVGRGENVGQRLTHEAVDDVIVRVLSESSNLLADVGVDSFKVDKNWHRIALGGNS